MKTIPYGQSIPDDAIEVFNIASGMLIIDMQDDYDKLPDDIARIVSMRQLYTDVLAKQFEAEQQAQKEAEYAAFKARAGAPSYKAAAAVADDNSEPDNSHGYQAP